MRHGLVLLGSPRPDGSSDSLARQFMEGAAEHGLRLETLPLREYRIRPCTHCGGCRRPPHRCVLAAEDDAEHILCALEQTPLLLLAAPIYFYALPGQLKCLVDRAQSRWAARQAKAARQEGSPPVSLSLLVAGRPRGEQLFAGSELCLSYFLRALGRELTQSQHLRGIESPSDIVPELGGVMRDWGRRQAAPSCWWRLSSFSAPLCCGTKDAPEPAYLQYCSVTNR